MVKIYSLRLSAEQNAAFERFEALTSCEPFGIHEFERGEMSARELWEKTMTQEQAKEMAAKWHELLGLADAADGSGNFDDAEAYRMKAADIEVDLAEAGFTASKLAAG